MRGVIFFTDGRDTDIYRNACQPLVRQLGTTSTHSVALVLVDYVGTASRDLLPELIDDWWADPDVDQVTAYLYSGGTPRFASEPAEFIASLRGLTQCHAQVTAVVTMKLADKSADKCFTLIVVRGASAAEEVRQAVIQNMSSESSHEQRGSSIFEQAEVVHVVIGRGSDGKEEYLRQALLWRLAMTAGPSHREASTDEQRYADAGRFLIEQGLATADEAADALGKSQVVQPASPSRQLSLHNKSETPSPSLLRARRKASGCEPGRCSSAESMPSPSVCHVAHRHAEYAADRLGYAQTLRRMMIAVAERDAYAAITHQCLVSVMSTSQRSARRGVERVEVLLGELEGLLEERDEAVTDLIKAKTAAFAGLAGLFQDAAQLHVNGGELPTTLGGRRRTMSGASQSGPLANDSLCSSPTRGRATTIMDGPAQPHQLVPVNSLTLPEWHRQLLASGGSSDIDARRKNIDPSRIPQMRVSAIQKESQSWKAFTDDLCDFRKMCAYEIFLVGEPNSGKSSVATCMTNPAPRFFKKAPQVPGPSLVASTTLHTIQITKTPQCAVPHGGLILASMSDVTRVLRDQPATGAPVSYGVRITELPTPVLRAAALPGLFPAKGAVYFLLYDLRERRHISRLAIESVVKHIVALATASRNQLGIEMQSAFQIPFVLMGTHRDEIAELNNAEDQSPLQSLLRSQRDWLEGLLKAIGTGTGHSLLLLDSFAASCAQWTVVGERPQSSSSFEAILHDSVNYLSLTSPCSPQHLLPTSSLLLCDDEPNSSQSLLGQEDSSRKQKYPNTVDQFWAQHGQNRSQSKPAPCSSLEEQVNRWLLDSSVGVVTLLTSLARCVEYSTAICDSQTLSNALLQHFNLTVEQKEATDDLLRLRSCVVEYFLRQCHLRGIIYRMTTIPPMNLDEGQAFPTRPTVLCSLRSSWIFSCLSSIMLPSTMQFHSDLPSTGPETQKLLARVGPRSPGHLLAQASQVLGIGNLADDPFLLQAYKLGVVPLQLVQTMCPKHLTPAFSTTDSVMSLVQSLRIGAGSIAKFVLGPFSSLSRTQPFFLPSVAKQATMGLLNIVGYTAQVVADSTLVGSFSVSCLPLNFLGRFASYAATHGVHGGELQSLVAFQNAVLLGTESSWAILVEDPEHAGVLKYVGGQRLDAGDSSNSNGASKSRAAFASFEGSLSRLCEEFESPCVLVSHSTVDSEIPNSSIDAWAEVERNLRSLIYQAASDVGQDAAAIADRVLPCVRQMVEHTTEPQLTVLMNNLEELL